VSLSVVALSLTRNAHAHEMMRMLRNKQQRRLVCLGLGNKPHVDQKSGKKSPIFFTVIFFSCKFRRCCLFPFPPPRLAP